MAQLRYVVAAALRFGRGSARSRARLPLTGTRARPWPEVTDFPQPELWTHPRYNRFRLKPGQWCAHSSRRRCASAHLRLCNARPDSSCRGGPQDGRRFDGDVSGRFAAGARRAAPGRPPSPLPQLGTHALVSPPAVMAAHSGGSGTATPLATIKVGVHRDARKQSQAGRTQTAHSAAEAWALAATSPHRWMSSKRFSGPSPRLATCERAATVRAAECCALAVTPPATAPSCGWVPCLPPTAAPPSWRRRWRTGRAARRTAAKRRPVCWALRP